MVINNTNPIGRHREKQKAETNALILDTSRALFEEMGYEKTTMRKIAAKAGLSHGAIFKHFKNKSDLLASSLFNDIQTTVEDAFNSIPKKETIQKQFLYFSKHIFKYYSRKPDLSKIFYEHCLFLEGEWRSKFDVQNDFIIKKVAVLVEKAKERKEIKIDANSELVAFAFLSLHLSVQIIWIRGPILEPDYAIQLLEPLINQVITGAGTNKHTEIKSG